MIRYQYITRREAIAWQERTPIDPSDDLTDFRTNYNGFCDMDHLVAVIATDGDKVVGRNLFFHCPILVKGRPVECIVTNNLFVHPDYRPKGVGTYLKMYVLKLGYPQISSGVSPSMQKVYDAWNAYHKIDSSPVYSVPADAFGLLRISRIASQSGANRSSGSTTVGIEGIKRTKSMLRLLLNRNLPVNALAPDDAVKRLDELLSLQPFAVQLPWSKSLLSAGLKGQDQRLHAWVVNLRGSDDVESHFLLTGYLKKRRVRSLGTRQRTITELHLNEIFPPVKTQSEARAMISFTLRQTRRLGASILQVYAMTDALRTVCEQTGLDSFVKKRVYIAPNTRDPFLIQALTKPNNWWCRAINEDQFEELGQPRPGLSQMADVLPHTNHVT